MDHRLHDRLHPLTEDLRNPLRNEADAFRLLVIVGLAAAAVIVAAVLIGGLAGALLGLVLVGIGAWRVWNWTRASLAARQPPEDGKSSA